MGDRLQVVLPATALLLTAIDRDWQGSRQFGVGFAATMASSHLLKGVITKGRPDGNGANAFPSAHSAVVFHAAGFVHKRYGFKRALAFYGAAAWTGYSRIYDDRHDFADVATGAAIGLVAAAFLTTRVGDVTVTPELAEGYTGIRLTYVPGFSRR